MEAASSPVSPAVSAPTRDREPKGGTETTTGGEGHDHGDETEDHDEENETEDHDEENETGDHHGENETEGGGHAHAEDDLSEASPEAEVAMLTEDGETHFEPHAVRVEVGGTVTFRLENGSHSATAYAPENDRPRRIPEGAEGWDTGVLEESGGTAEHTFETAGVYDYYCVPHESQGMVGSVVVGDPDPSDQPGLADPQDSLPDAAQDRIEELNERVADALGDSH